MAYSRKKVTTGVGYGISRGIEEIASGISRGYYKSNMIFPVVSRKNYGISRGLGFRP